MTDKIIPYTDRDVILDIISDGIMNRYDIDTNSGHWAEGAYDAMAKEGYILVHGLSRRELVIALDTGACRVDEITAGMPADNLITKRLVEYADRLRAARDAVLEGRG